MGQTLLRKNRIARTSGEHRHDFPQLLLGCRGVTECEFDSNGQGVGPDKMVLVPGDASHGYEGKGEDSELLVIDIQFDDPAVQLFESTADRALNDHLFNSPRFLDMSPSIRSLVAHAAWQLGHPTTTGDSGQVLAQQWALMLIAQIYQTLEQSPEHASRRQLLSPALLNRLIDQRIAEPLDNRQLAHLLNMSVSRLHRLFVMEFEATPQQYIMSRRMEWARHWLKLSQKPVGVIALDLGFADTASFSRAFQRCCGVSPSRFRQQQPGLSAV
ncbi:AraC family transcriptional regulator [Marinobacter xestospongiae]|uniref:AraC family transcriptional regulator n=1 Tax=Marinobacter xestospongiae TaxID=994319 RepID=UPI00200301B4|nr:AraC family transcriptional regulator [Marinobacter xestospongiae]MCK7565295.1 AraC family transcriptional regulator [Marinobacter xestospongiae]